MPASSPIDINCSKGNLTDSKKSRRSVRCLCPRSLEVQLLEIPEVGAYLDNRMEVDRYTSVYMPPQKVRVSQTSFA